VKLLVYRDGSANRTGLLSAEKIYDLAKLARNPAYADIGAVMADWSRVTGLFEQNSLTPDSLVGKQGTFRLGPPLDRSCAIFCAAANFKDHMIAMARKLNQEPEPDPHENDVKPYHFLKPTRQTLVGPDETVKLPAYAAKVDWEVELVAVIGKAAHRVSVDRALSYVAGYTIGNDLSVRDADYMKRPNVPVGSLFRTDFLGMKGFDGSCPIGPWIAPASTIGDPQKLSISLSVDGEVMQKSNTSEMIFSVAEQISYLSARTTLLPGDAILTGTPAGTGAEQDRFLKPGQVVCASIDKIGELRTFIE
jgi:2-keto-4-pentenoate hydratase/2-oxohepta-3-ene-1,7-dioic acid hydratase in catechol pathway